MHIWKRLLCLLLPLCISGCGQAASQSTSSVAGTLTGVLTVYGWDDNLNNSMLSDAIRLFKRQNPNVEVDYRTFSEGEMDTILTTELIAGKGPDVVLFYDEIADPFKTADANIFCDLNPFLEADPDFDRSAYNAMFDEGCYRGGRYFIPLFYNTYSLMTSQSALERAGLSLEDAATLPGLTEQLAQFMQTHTAEDIAKAIRVFMPDPRVILSATGLQLIDHESQEVVLQPDAAREAVEFWNVLYPYLSDYANSPWRTEVYTFGDDTKALHQGALVYELGAPMGLIELELDAMRQFSGEDYLQFSAIPNIEEGKPVAIRDLCAAIRNSSANKQAAYSLLKILLSDVVQRAHVVTIPVLNSAVGIQLDELQQQNEITQEQRDAYEAYFTDVQPYTYYSSKLWEIFFQYFTPYWEGDATFESCYDKLYSALELYLYE